MLKKRVFCLLCLAALLAWPLFAAGEQLTLPRSLRTIGEEAYAGDGSLDEVVLPEGLTSIGPRAFAGSSVRRVYFPERLRDIAEDAFDNCAGVTGWGAPYTYAAAYCAEHGIPYTAHTTLLEEFTFEFTSDTEATLTGWNGLNNYSNKTVTVPPMADDTHVVTAIGEKAFYQKSWITSVYLPDTVESIGSEAFLSCHNLAMIRLPRDLTFLGSMAFAYCYRLEDVEFNEGLKVICSMAFSHCQGLTDADLPDSVEEIRGGYVFSNASSLKSFHYPLHLSRHTNSQGEEGDTPGGGLFFRCPMLTDIEVPEGVTRLPAWIFGSAESLTHITLPSTLEEIGDYAFYNCTGLAEIDLPDSVREIGFHAFNGCSGLTSITLPRGLENLDEWAFYECQNLQELIYQPGVTTVMESYLDHTSIQRIYMPETATVMRISGIRDGVFYNTSLKDDKRNRFKAWDQTELDLEIWTEYGADAVIYAANSGIPCYYLSATGSAAPDETVIVQKGGLLEGSIRSTVPITSVRAVVRNASSGKTVRSASDAPNTETYSLKGRISTQLNLAGLPKGRYTYTLSASTAKSEEVVAESAFAVNQDPPKVSLTGFNISPVLFAFTEQGTNQLIRGRLSSELPMTRVTIRAEAEGVTPVEKTAEPGSKAYNLEDLDFNIRTLEPGMYTISVLAEGEGFRETPGTGRLQITGLPDAAGTIDRQKLEAFIHDEDNRNYLYKNPPWTTVAHLKIRVLESASGVGKAAFINRLNMYFSNHDDYINAMVRTIFSGDFNGVENRQFYVDLAREEIEILIQAMEPAYFDECGYDPRMVQVIRTALENNAPLQSGAFDEVMEDGKDWINELIDTYNLFFKTEYDPLHALGEIPAVTRILVDSLTDYIKTNTVLDLLDTQHAVGQYSIYYQEAVADLRKAYQSQFAYAFDSLIEEIKKKVVDLVIDQVTDQLLMEISGPLVPLFKLASIINKGAGILGYYDEADDFVTFLMQVETFFTAERAYEEAFAAMYEGGFKEADVQNMDTRLRFARYCGMRAMTKLSEMMEAGYGYLDNVDGEVVREAMTALSADTVIPYLNY